jgi:hypothetical protein
MRCALLVLLGLTCLSAPAALAQDSTFVFVGRVVDARAGSPVPMAAVHLGQRIADTDSAGVFRICRLPGGPAVVQVLAEGYQTVSLQTTISESDSSVVIRVQPMALEAKPPLRIDERPGPNSHRAVFIVDGEPAFYDSSKCAVPPAGMRHLDSIAREDIESIEILKGTAPATRPGTLAEHPTILITTKQGKSAPPP